MPKSNVVQKEWERYVDTVGLSGAPAVQIQECRRAFYAGAWAVQMAIARSLDPEPHPTEGDVAMLEDILSELIEFAEFAGTPVEGSRQEPQ